MSREDYFDHAPLQHLNSLLIEPVFTRIDDLLLYNQSSDSMNKKDGGSVQRESIDYVLTFDSYVNLLFSALKLHNFHQVVRHLRIYYQRYLYYLIDVVVFLLLGLTLRLRVCLDPLCRLQSFLMRIFGTTSMIPTQSRKF